jgi:virulence-associated protein VagC
MRLRIWLGALALALLGVVAVAGAAGTSKTTNGDFELGKLTHWNGEHSGPGRWRIVGNQQPQPKGRDGWNTGSRRGDPFTPLDGDYSAGAFQNFISSQFMYRTLTIDPASKNVLKMKVAYQNEAGDFVPADDFSLDHENQQFRIDVMKKSSPLDSLDSGDVLKNVLMTREGDDPAMSPANLSTNLSSLSQHKVRLRFAVAVTDSPLFAEVDDVKLVKTPR